MDARTVTDKQAIVTDAATFEKATSRGGSENFNCAEFVDEEEMQDVVESFELLHRTIPWLQRADVSSESHCGQLKILQAAIDYIIDLEEQLAEQLSGDLYLAALQSGRLAIQRSLAAGSSVVGARRPFADVNAAATSPSSPQPPPSAPRLSPVLPLLPMSPVSHAGLTAATRIGAGGLCDHATDALEGRQC